MEKSLSRENIPVGEIHSFFENLILKLAVYCNQKLNL